MALRYYGPRGLHDESYITRSFYDDMYIPKGHCEEEYGEKLQRILEGPPYTPVPREPTKIVQGVYLGAQADAENTNLLRRIGITHAVNASGRPKVVKKNRRNPFSTNEHGIEGYLQVDADDDDLYPITMHFRMVSNFIWRARKAGGKVLIYGEGVSRSGALMLAYLMQRGHYLLEAARLLKDSRYTVLTNRGFMQQLLAHAKENGMLDPKPEKVRTPPQFGLAGDRERILRNCLPHVSLTQVWWRGTAPEVRDLPRPKEIKEPKRKLKKEKIERE